MNVLTGQANVWVAATAGWTIDQLRALPDDGRFYEIIDGELLVTPVPVWRHQRAAGALFLRLQSYLSAHGIGEAITAPQTWSSASALWLSRPADERPEIAYERLMWNPEGAAEPFVLDVAEFFAAIGKA